MKIPVFLLLIALLFGCNQQPGPVKNYGVNVNTPLFAFVGEKIWVEPLPADSNEANFNQGFKAKYKILQKVYGDFPEETIEFLAYDHYGTPPFSKFKNVLLYLSADSGTYYQEKYMFNAVYKTKDGRWAGWYAQSDYDHSFNKYTPIRPVKIDFAERMAFPVKTITDRGDTMFFSYNDIFSSPEPYYKKEGDSMVAVYGNYAEDLFTLKRTGFFTARGIFEMTDQQDADDLRSRQPVITEAPTKGDLQFLAFWPTFTAAILDGDMTAFKKIASDSITIGPAKLSTTYFIDHCFASVFDDEVKRRLNDTTKLDYTKSWYGVNDLDHKDLIRTMEVICSERNHHSPTVEFEFSEIEKGYRLHTIHLAGAAHCCK